MFFNKIKKWFSDTSGIIQYQENKALKLDEDAFLLRSRRKLESYWLGYVVRVNRGTHPQLDGAEGIARGIKADYFECKDYVDIVFIGHGCLPFKPESLTRGRKSEYADSYTQYLYGGDLDKVRLDSWKMD